MDFFNLARLRQSVLKNAFSIAEQTQAVFRALQLAVVAALVLAVILIMLIVGSLGSGASFLLVFAGALEVIAAIAVTVLATLAQRVIRDSAVRPLDELSAMARRLAGGDLEAVSEPHGALELQQIGSTLGVLANAVRAERGFRVADRHAGEKENTSLREILRITRAVGSHLEPEPILEQLATGAKRLGGYSEAVIWRYEELDNELVPVYPPNRLQGANALQPVKVAKSPVGRAASSGQTFPLRAEAGRGTGVAVPLTVGGVGLRIMGVLELRGDTGAAMVSDPIDALETLASHAATALAAAQLYEQLELRSETDALTRLFNRRKLEVDLRSEVGRSLRYGHALTLIMVDVDHFKGVNDTFGHQTGDEVLRMVANTIGHGRETDAAYRFGGEEFAVLLRETDVRAARAVAERMRLKIRENVATMGLPRDVTASLGLASISAQVRSPEQLVEAADQALYQAKSTGRNRVVVSPLTAPRLAVDVQEG